MDTNAGIASTWEQVIALVGLDETQWSNLGALHGAHQRLRAETLRVPREQPLVDLARDLVARAIEDVTAAHVAREEELREQAAAFIDGWNRGRLTTVELIGSLENLMTDKDVSQ